MEASDKTVNLVLRDLPLALVPALRIFLENQGDAVGACLLDLLEPRASNNVDAAATLTQSERHALKHPAHRRHAERLERLLWEGMAEASMTPMVTALFGNVKIQYNGKSTRLFHEARSLKACANQLLINRERHGMGADGVLLMRDPKDGTHWFLHLFQVKAGATMISNTKSTCGETNKSRCTYYIARGLIDIGEHLSMLLRLQFPSSPRQSEKQQQKKKKSVEATTVTCVYHFMTFSPLGASARADLKARDIHAYEADACYALLPQRVRDAYQLIDSHFERR
jgi:hypothetical protein